MANTAHGIIAYTTMHYLEFAPWVIGLLLIVAFVPRKLGKHAYFVRLSRKKLNTLQRIAKPAMQMAYCKKVNPYVFEEMVLTALERSGCRIKRNRRYSADGGIDGKVWIGGHQYLIQSKRYGQHIKAAHVEAFVAMCHQKNQRGLFVHTGKTGKLARASQSALVKIISGQELLDLLTRYRLQVG